jgi:hypothetical protein
MTAETANQAPKQSKKDTVVQNQRAVHIQTVHSTSHAVTSNVPCTKYQFISMHSYYYLIKAQSTHDRRNSQSGSKAVQKTNSNAISTCSAYTTGAQCAYQNSQSSPQVSMTMDNRGVKTSWTAEMQGQ